MNNLGAFDFASTFSVGARRASSFGWTIGTNPAFSEIRGFLKAGETNGPYGALSPNAILGVEINRLQCNTGNHLVILALGDATEQIAGVDAVRMTFNGSNPIDLAWASGTSRYQLTDSTMSGLILAATDDTVRVTLRAVP